MLTVAVLTQAIANWTVVIVELEAAWTTHQAAGSCGAVRPFRTMTHLSNRVQNEMFSRWEYN